MRVVWKATMNGWWYCSSMVLSGGVHSTIRWPSITGASTLFSACIVILVALQQLPSSKQWSPASGKYKEANHAPSSLKCFIIILKLLLLSMVISLVGTHFAVGAMEWETCYGNRCCIQSLICQHIHYICKNATGWVLAYDSQSQDSAYPLMHVPAPNSKLLVDVAKKLEQREYE